MPESKKKKRFHIFSPSEQKTKRSCPNTSTASQNESSPGNDSSILTYSDIPPPPTSDIPLQIVSAHLPQSISREELAKTILSLATVVQKLQVQNAELIGKVDGLETKVTELTSELKAATTSKKTFAEIVTKSLAAPAAQISFIRAAELAKSSETRKNSVVVRNVDLAADASEDESFGKKLANECKVSGQCTVFRITMKDKAPPLMKIQLNSKEDALKVLSSFDQVKSNINGCRAASVRQDYSKPELAKYRQAWKEVIRLNNEKKQRIFTVRNLEVVKIRYAENQSPWPWTVHQVQKQ